MSQHNRAIPFRRTHPLSLVVISALFGALLLAVFSSTATAQNGDAIGRGFAGVAMSIDPGNGLLTVESQGAFFQLLLTGSTVINNPPNRDVGLEGLPADLGYRIAGLVDLPITDAAGNVTPELLTAQKITVIPEIATRRHKRTIAVDKQGDDLTTLDDSGVRTELPGRGEGFEKGDPIIMLVQTLGQNGTGEEVRAIFKADLVNERLDRLADAEADDPGKTANLAELRNKRVSAQEEYLQKTADNAGTDYRDIVLETVRVMRDGTERRTATPECSASPGTAGCMETTDAVPSEPPVIQITSPSSDAAVSPNDVITVTAEAKDDVGVVSVTLNVAGTDLAQLTEAPYAFDITVPAGGSSVEIKATAADADGNEVSDEVSIHVTQPGDVGVKITSPAAGAVIVVPRKESSRLSTVDGSTEAISEGDTISIRAEVTGTGAVTVVFAVNDVEQTPLFVPPYSMRYFVPLTPAAEDPPPLKITATATDGTGSTASDSMNITVVRNTAAVNVKITDPPSGTKVKSGDTIVINAGTDNDADIATVTFSVDGIETITTTAPFSRTYVVPQRSASPAAVSSVPPNVFVGAATLDGVAAPDDTVVIAWIGGSDVATLTIEVTATANSGVTGSATLLLPATGFINAGQATVKDGKYVLNASQPSGQNFTGQTITFTVGGKDAVQTATWQRGDAEVLDLTAN